MEIPLDENLELVDLKVKTYNENGRFFAKVEQLFLDLSGELFRITYPKVGNFENLPLFSFPYGPGRRAGFNLAVLEKEGVIFSVEDLQDPIKFADELDEKNPHKNFLPFKKEDARNMLVSFSTFGISFFNADSSIKKISELIVEIAEISPLLSEEERKELKRLVKEYIQI